MSWPPVNLMNAIVIENLCIIMLNSLGQNTLRDDHFFRLFLISDYFISVFIFFFRYAATEYEFRVANRGEEAF